MEYTQEGMTSHSHLKIIRLNLLITCFLSHLLQLLCYALRDSHGWLSLAAAGGFICLLRRLIHTSPIALMICSLSIQGNRWWSKGLVQSEMLMQHFPFSCKCVSTCGERGCRCGEAHSSVAAHSLYAAGILLCALLSFLRHRKVSREHLLLDLAVPTRAHRILRLLHRPGARSLAAEASQLNTAALCQHHTWS